MPFIPHTDEEVAKMLATIGAPNIEALFAEIPSNLKIDALSLPEAQTEWQLKRTLTDTLSMPQYQNYAGAGAYEHHIPEVVWQLASRGEWMSAYTPYQAEVSQGTLQLIYEYQSMMCALTGMSVSNASLYDGATALAEAILMALRLTKKRAYKRVIIPQNIHPYYRAVLEAIVASQGVTLLTLPFNQKTGQLDDDALTDLLLEGANACVVAQPNFFGQLESVHTLTDKVHQHDSLLIALVNPISLGMLIPPGQWGTRGADIVCGEGQSLGNALNAGGPYFGFLTCQKPYIRQLPGRIVARTNDQAGRIGFSLTLQAREQHIRRAKATSNICTNQGLMVTAATIYMAIMGGEGIQKVAHSAHQNTKKLIEALVHAQLAKRVFTGDFFHECIVRLPMRADIVVDKMCAHNIFAGVALNTYCDAHTHDLLICVTETKTSADLERYVALLRQVCGLHTK